MLRVVANAIAGGLAAIVLMSEADAYGTLPLQLAQHDVPLGGHADRFDYQSVDAKRRLLFISHLGSGIVTVFDMRRGAVVRQIQDLPGVHGVLVVPALHEIFATVTDRDELDAISEDTFGIVARIPTGHYPDGMAYDPRDNKLFISDESGDTETVIDVKGRRAVATIPLGGDVGNSQYDPASDAVFVAVQTRDEIVEIDPSRDAIVGRFPLPPSCDDDHGLLLDPVDRIAFVACDGNARLLTVSLGSMRVLSDLPTGAEPDVLALDPQLGRLYVAAESGVVSAFRVEGHATRPIGSGFVAVEAHSVAVDPVTHRVFFPLQAVRGVSVLRIMSPLHH